MPSTYYKILLHVTFSTKHRQPLITPDMHERLYPYMGGIVRAEKGRLECMGGMPDHVHMLLSWRTDETVAALLRTVKSRSSGWVHKSFPALRGFAWQEGYGVFSVSASRSDTVRKYIANQAQHHRIRSFQEEFVRLLKAHDIEYDEQYLWD